LQKVAFLQEVYFVGGGRFFGSTCICLEELYFSEERGIYGASCSGDLISTFFTWLILGVSTLRFAASTLSYLFIV